MAKKPGCESVYEAASRWVDAALRNDDSLFTPGTAIWSLRNLDDLHDRFVSQPDVSDDSFQQFLFGLPPETYQLAAEAFYFHFLLPHPSAVKGDTKRGHIEGVLEWAEHSATIPDDLAAVLDSGLVNPGSAFARWRYRQLSLICQFVRRWKRLPQRDRDEALRDPWAFKRELFELNVAQAQTQREALLHLIFPDTFEPITAENRKRNLVSAFNYLVESPTEDVDKKIVQIRSRLTQDYGYKVDIDFFGGRMTGLWIPGGEPDPWGRFIHWARRFFNWPKLDETERNFKLKIAERLGRGRTIDDWQTKEWSESLDSIFKHKFPLVSHFTYNPFLRWFREEPGQAQATLDAIWMSGLAANELISGFSERLPQNVVNGRGTRLNLASFLMMGVDAYDYPIYQVTALQKGFDLTGHAHPPSEADEAETYEHALGFFDRIVQEASKRGLKLRDRLDAQSLLWLMVKWPVEDLPLSEAERRAFGRYRGEVDDGGVEAVDDVVDGTQALSLKNLAEELSFEDAEFLYTTKRLLEDKRQVIFYGPPGTGKTFVARELAKTVAGEEGAVQLVQFHPSYAYEDFVEGFRPAKLESGQAGFELRQGPLTRLADRAYESESEAIHVLVIDEINRGNLAKVFGELYFLLEYRDENITLQYSDEEFSLPENLWIIGTMNTADRTISLLDAALRRRFHFLPFFPDEEPINGLLRRWLKRNNSDFEWVADVVDWINQQLGDRQTAVGPSHFMRKDEDLDEKWIDLVWEYSVVPYLKDQLMGQEDRYRDFEDFDLKRIRQSVQDAQSSETGE